MDGLEISTDKLDLAAPDPGIVSLSNFHKVSRAEGPKRTDGVTVGGQLRRSTSLTHRGCMSGIGRRGKLLFERGMRLALSETLQLPTPWFGACALSG